MALLNALQISYFFISACLAANYPALYKIWDTRRIPYNISQELAPAIVSTVHTAFQRLQQTTCVKFEPRTEYDFDYLQIEPGPSCETYVGKKGGRQILELNSDCSLTVGNVIHELLHTLGFHHEHQRKDRDQYVNVYLDNALQSKIDDDFLTKRPFLSNLAALPYDYMSLTHYGEYQFSKNTMPTIQTIDDSKQGFIGQRDHLSQLDVVKVQMYYNCEVDSPMLNVCDQIPPQPVNGTWRSVQGIPQSVGNIIEYSCDDGYTLVGPTTRSCLLDGTWLAYSPYCIEDPIMYCNFDEGNWCDWTPSYEGVNYGYWNLNQRGTHDTQTGPNNDYTTMASQGFFAYVKARMARSNSDVAILTSPVITTSFHCPCFRFSYSMFGQNIGNLNVYLLDGSTQTHLFERIGGQGPNWFNETIYDLPLNATVQIEFRITMTGLPKGDIALDDLLITECDQLHV